jgi:hypothetical protein
MLHKGVLQSLIGDLENSGTIVFSISQNPKNYHHLLIASQLLFNLKCRAALRMSDDYEALDIAYKQIQEEIELAYQDLAC